MCLICQYQSTQANSQQGLTLEKNIAGDNVIYVNCEFKAKGINDMSIQKVKALLIFTNDFEFMLVLHF